VSIFLDAATLVVPYVVHQCLTQDHTKHDLNHKEIGRVTRMPLKINEVIDAKSASSFPPRRWARLHLMPRSVKIHVISGFFQSELNSTTLDLHYYLERSAGFAIVTCMLQLSNLDLLLQPLLVTGMPPIPSTYWYPQFPSRPSLPTSILPQDYTSDYLTI
jgi:hypothetical protein